MKPIEFKEQNVVLAENQEEYSPLPSYLDDGPEGYVISCWSLSVRERFSLLLGGCIWISQMSFHRPAQPLYVTTDKGDLFILSQQRGFKGACKGLGRGFKGALKKLFLLVFIALAFVACKPDSVSGYVVDMEFVPEHSMSYYDVVLKMPRVKRIPDKYFVWVADRNRSQRIEVNRSFYKQLRKGQYINLKNN